MTESHPCRICGEVHPRGLGGTAMGRIFGLVPKTNAIDVFHSLTRPPLEKDPGQAENIHTLRGHAFEGMALDHFWARTGWKGRATRKVSTHPKYPAFQCHTDFEIAADADRKWKGEPAPAWMLGRGVGETKSPSSGVVQHMLDYGLRQYEMLQGYTYAAVTRRDWFCFNFFTMEHEAGPTIPIPLAVPDGMSAFLLESGQRFWDEHVVPRVPPDPTEWELLAKEGMPPLPDLSGDRLVIEDDEVRDEALALLKARDLMDQAEELYASKLGPVYERLLATGHKRFDVAGAGRFSIVQKAGTVSFSRASLETARPLDWDLVREFLFDELNNPTEGSADLASIDEDLISLQLDLARFERRGDPSQFLLLPRRLKEEGGNGDE